MTTTQLCTIPTHRGHRYYANRTFGCDACTPEAWVAEFATEAEAVLS